MNAIKAIINEYNNLWNEKLIHKASIRKFNNYIANISSAGSLVLAIMGIPTSMLPQFLSKDTANLLLIPIPLIIILLLSFTANDLFHIYAIGTRIGVLEEKINKFLDAGNLFAWEHRICPFIYGGEKNISCEHCQTDVEPIKSVIKLSNNYILFPFALLILLSSAVLGIIFLFGINIYFSVTYLIILAYFSFMIIFKVGKNLKKYTEAGSPLTIAIRVLSNC